MSTLQKSLTILVVDDNADQAVSLSLLLKGNGYDSHVCIHALECLALVERLRPDVVLLDLAMPGKSGYDIARDIRSNPAMQAIMLVAVTGHGLPLDRVQSRITGFDQHLMKPVAMKELETILESVQQEE